jgi:2-polyprenyl-3-methyl-5-hydroxy-6-metoxy-1,4-benzoquinol methylase
MPDTNVKSHIIDEAAEFLGTDRDYVVKKIAEMKAILHKIWAKKNPSSLDALRKFYNEEPLHFFNVLDFNTWSDAQYPPVDFREYNIKLALDYGCGCGTTALALLDKGVEEIAIAELSEPLRNFAIWRLNKKGIKPLVIEVKDFRPLDRHFDLITTIDVLEHLPHPIDMVYHFAKHARYLYSTALKPQDMSQHLNLWPKEEVVKLFEILGWRALWLAKDEGRGFFESAID